MIWDGEPKEHPFVRKIELRSRLRGIRARRERSKDSSGLCIVLEGLRRKVELRIIPSKPGTHQWENPFPESLVLTSDTKTQKKCADVGDNKTTRTGPRYPKWFRVTWFFPSIHHYAHIDREVLCLTIVRWQRDWVHVWYSASLVLVE